MRTIAIAVALAALPVQAEPVGGVYEVCVQGENGVAGTAEAGAAEDLVSLQVSGVSAVELAAQLGKLSGRTIVFEPQDDATFSVTAKSVPLSELLVALSSHGPIIAGKPYEKTEGLPQTAISAEILEARAEEVARALEVFVATAGYELVATRPDALLSLQVADLSLPELLKGLERTAGIETRRKTN